VTMMHLGARPRAPGWTVAPFSTSLSRQRRAELIRLPRPAAPGAPLLLLAAAGCGESRERPAANAERHRPRPVSISTRQAGRPLGCRASRTGTPAGRRTGSLPIALPPGPPLAGYPLRPLARRRGLRGDGPATSCRLSRLPPGVACRPEPEGEARHPRWVDLLAADAQPRLAAVPGATPNDPPAAARAPGPLVHVPAHVGEAPTRWPRASLPRALPRG